MMKKTGILILVLLCVVISFAACSDKNTANSEGNGTETDAVSEIVGDEISEQAKLHLLEEMEKVKDVTYVDVKLASKEAWESGTLFEFTATRFSDNGQNEVSIFVYTEDNTAFEVLREVFHS